MRLFFSALFFLFLTLTAGSFAQNFPMLTARVVDQAALLTPETRRALEDKLKAYETQTGTQVVVATISTLEGYEIADYANRLFRVWKLGQKDKNNGVLLLIAAQERKVRIEVGYGLEGTLTDATARLIIQNALVPRFKAGDPDGGVTRAVEDILLTLQGDTTLTQSAARGAAPAEELTFDQILPLLIFLFIAFLIISNALRQNRRRMNSGLNNGSWVIIPSGGFGGGFGGGGGGFSDGGGFSGDGGSSGGGGASGSW